MEVGAVKQAFNNEVIQLKKNLNQAKLQVIHKLTRKAKTLTEKKTPDHLKEKNKRKAESAVKEVLLMKKLKPRDIARFIITYKGELSSHLNKPIVDNDKACARLLLHKSLQQKYKIIKDKFGDIPIKDLLMSRQERRKLKKEAKDAQKNKKKGKEGKVVNSKGDWNVEDIKMGEENKESNQSGDSNDEIQENDDVSNDKDEVDDVSINEDEDNGSANISEDDETPVTRQVVNDSDESSDGEPLDNDQESVDGESDVENIAKEESSDDEEQKSGSDVEIIHTKKLKHDKQTKPVKIPKMLIPKPVEQIPNHIEEVLSKLKPRKPDKKVKENKNKNLNDKLLNRKFKRDNDDSQNAEKVVDPFFKTASGENYMSVAEPRQPDEIKEVHRQGNRQERRAVMFGRVPMKPKRDNKQNFRSNYNKINSAESNEKFKRFDGDVRKSKFNDRNSFNNKNSTINDKNSKFNDRNSKFNDRNSNDRKFKATEPKDEKLHPSWEAKKKQSGILPFKGKKIVFDE